MKFVFLISLLFLSIINAQDDCVSNLLIETNIPDSKIYLNDDLVGEGRLETSLEKGRYEIVVMQSKREWGSQVFQDSLLIETCGESFNYSYDFERKIIIESHPEDAAVIDEDSLIGYTPIKLLPNSPELLIQKNGYSSEKIILKEKEKIYKVPLKFTGVKTSEPFTRKPLFKILIGSAVVLGATAAYLKLEADDKFDKYLETRQQEYLDETDTYDLYSGLAFGALQINFGALLYFFLFD